MLPRRFRTAGCAALVSVALISAPAMAEDRSAEELARDGVESLMRAMDMFIGSIPMYEAPEILPNGDIIIRRVQPDGSEDGDKEGQGADGDVTET
ncbi:MAG: hypothetical protein RIM33_01615 [Alphaproteobacteria bacterium]